MSVLTPEQRQLLAEAGRDPVRIEDPETHQTYVLMPAEIYDRMQEALEEQQDRRERQAFLEASQRAAIEWMRENPY